MLRLGFGGSLEWEVDDSVSAEKHRLHLPVRFLRECVQPQRTRP